MPEVTDLRPGDPQEIAGYQVISRLGAGGQGVVYLATATTGERVAIKQLRSVEDERARQQLTKEVAAARLVAPFCTAQVVDAQLDGPSPYVVSEYIEGPSLQQQIQRHGPMTGVTLHRLAIGTATALAAIHQVGVVHRDFKPANVMLSPQGPRVIDFGIARDLSTETTVTSRIFGTPAYMAPEQLRAEPVGPAADMFAWASVIAYAATGRAPFEASHIMAVVHRITTGDPNLAGVPDDLLGVLRLCLDKDAARRPSAQQALAMLLGRPAPARDLTDATQVLAEATVIVRPTGPASTVQQPGQPSRDFPSATALGGAPANLRTPPALQPAARQSIPPSEPPPWGQPPQGPPNGNAGAGRNRRAPIAAGIGAVLLLVLAIGGAKALANRNQADGSSTDPTTSTSSTVSPVKHTGTGSPATTAPSTSDEGDNDSSDNDSGDDDSDDSGTVAGHAVPEAFDGTWEGTAQQPRGNVKSWSAQIKLEGGTSGGTMILTDPSLGCSGPLIVESASAQLLVLDSVIDHDPNAACAPGGTIRLTLLSNNRLNYIWTDATDSVNVAFGTFTKN